MCTTNHVDVQNDEKKKRAVEHYTCFYFVTCTQLIECYLISMYVPKQRGWPASRLFLGSICMVPSPGFFTRAAGVEPNASAPRFRESGSSK